MTMFKPIVFAQGVPKHLLFNLDHFVYYSSLLILRKEKVILIHYFFIPKMFKIDNSSWSREIFFENIWHTDVKKFTTSELEICPRGIFAHKQYGRVPRVYDLCMMFHKKM